MTTYIIAQYAGGDPVRFLSMNRGFVMWRDQATALPREVADLIVAEYRALHDGATYEVRPE